MKSILKMLKGAGWLNLLGMSVAFAAIYIILVQVHYDLGFNRSLPDSERLYVVGYPAWADPNHYMLTRNRPSTEPAILQSSLVDSYGVVAAAAPEQKASLIKAGDNRIDLRLKLFKITRGALDLFDFEPISGSFQGMQQAETVAVSERLVAQTGATVGDELKLGDDNTLYTIAAVFKNQPVNTELNEMDVVSCYGMDTQDIDNSGNWSYLYYVKLRSPQDKERFETEANALIRKTLLDAHGDGEMNDFEKMRMERSQLTLLPVTELHFNELVEYYRYKADKTGTLVLLTVAVLILIIALINYVNFFLAQVPLRLKSVNTRKILGSSRFSLVLQFVCESGVMVMMALLVAVAWVLWVRGSHYSELLSCALDFQQNGLVVFLTILVALVMTVASSVYPALYITSFPPVLAIKGSMGSSKGSAVFRHTLVGFQFAVALIFVICASMFRMEYHYMMNYDMGFNKENVYSLNLDEADLSPDLLVDELKKASVIEDVTLCDGSLVSPDVMLTQMDDYEYISSYVAPNFLKFMGIEVVEGRDFVESDKNSSTSSMIFNEVGRKKMNLGLAGESGFLPIIGFCKDFHFQPLQYGVSSFAFMVSTADNLYTLPLTHLYLRAKPGVAYGELEAAVSAALSHLSATCSVDDLSLCSFDDELAEVYQKQADDLDLVTLFSMLAIAISLMGIVGLLMFEMTYRKKEIGVRRVHGAGVAEILLLFNRRFVYILCVSFVVAAPIAYYAMYAYYSSFVYRAPLSLWIFALAFVLVLLVTVAVVTLCTYKAANENPTQSLKNE